MNIKMFERLSWMLLLAAAGIILAASMSGAAEPVPHQAVMIHAGETFVIGQLNPNSAPTVVVIDNPHALLMHTETPGKIVLVGAEAGAWDITVQRANGLKVAYDVNVMALAKPQAPLAPGKAPAASTDMTLAPRPGAGMTAPADFKSASVDLTDTSIVNAAPASPSPVANAANAPIPVMPSQAQSVAPRLYRNDPTVLASGRGYSSPSVNGGVHYLPEDSVTLMTGTSEVVDFTRRLTRISVADSKVADVQVVNPYQINIIGHEPGFTTLAVWDNRGQYVERQVRIDPSGKQQVMLNVIVAELNRSKIENQGINITTALANAGVSLVGMPGNVGTPYSASGSSSGSSTPTTLFPGGQLMPMLLSSNLTYGLATQNGQLATQTFFQFLEQHELGRILAEPHMLANSGEKAKFLSGGEIPIVIAQALNTSIVFKQFGTSVEFIPTVVGSDSIELLVKPEVSEPDYAHGVQMFGFNIPAFVTRRAETLVRMRDQQTLIIAGLILHTKTATVQKVPYLGDIPYLGGLFRNTSWQDQDTDLVMSVTPQIVNALPRNGEVFDPTRVPDFSYQDIKTAPVYPPDPARPRF